MTNQLPFIATTMRITTTIIPLLLLCTPGLGVPLLDGRFETITNVTGYLNLASDIAAVNQSDDMIEKIDIYRKGRYAFDIDKDGQQVSISLASLSLNATGKMTKDPMFNIFRHAFQFMGEQNGEVTGHYGGWPVDQYADTIVGDLFHIDAVDIGIEAALVLNVWMAAVHELNDIVWACKNQQKQAGMAALDRVAALWIGGLQETGSNQNGHMLYNIAEIAGERFGQDLGEVHANKRILNNLNSLQTNLASEYICRNDTKSSVVRDEVLSLIGAMTIPLIQNFIHHIMNVDDEERSNYVDLYALAVVPRLFACDPNVYDAELNIHALKSVDSNERLHAVASLQKFYGCLRVSCSDIGSYMGRVVPQCEDAPNDPISMAGYVSPRREILSNSYVDRDMLQISIFLNFQAYDAAIDLYQHGHNAWYSLQDLALNKVIPGSPHSQFDLFKSYYGTESYDFADSEILNALRSESQFANASPNEISEVVLGLLRYEVLYLSVVSSLYFAVAECSNLKNASALMYWDMGAAFYIGSIEGNSVGGEAGGQLLYAASKDLCGMFGTCTVNESKNSLTNAVVVESFTSAGAALADDDCQTANTILEQKLIPALPTTLIQGMLANAAIYDEISPEAGNGSFATAYAFSRGVAPLIDEARPASAVAINQVMNSTLLSKPVVNGFSQVVNAVVLALPEMRVDCNDIGNLYNASISSF